MMSRKRWTYLAGFVFMAAIGGIAAYLLVLRYEVNRAVREAQTKLDLLIAQGGEEFALFQVDHVRAAMAEIGKHTSHPTRNHDQVIALARQAVKDADAGIERGKQKRGEAEIEAIQHLLIEAHELKAEYFTPDLWNECSEDFTTLVEHFWKKDYDFALRLAPKLMKQAADMARETQKASAKYQVDKLTERMEKMRLAEFNKALPDLFAQLETKYREAKALLEKEQYEKALTAAQLVHSHMNDVDDTLFIETTLGSFGVKVVSDYDVLAKICAAVLRTTPTRSGDAGTTAGAPPPVVIKNVRQLKQE